MGERRVKHASVLCFGLVYECDEGFCKILELVLFANVLLASRGPRSLTTYRQHILAGDVILPSAEYRLRTGVF